MKTFWNIETNDSSKVAGPYATQHAAIEARWFYPTVPKLYVVEYELGTCPSRAAPTGYVGRRFRQLHLRGFTGPIRPAGTAAMKIERDIDEDDRREAIDQRRQRRRRTIHRTYDDWKTDSGEDETEEGDQ